LNIDESSRQLLREYITDSLLLIIKDKDPAPLTEYIFAILQSDASLPQLKQSCSDELPELLGEEASKDFVRKLFSVLEDVSDPPYFKEKLKRLNRNSSRYRSDRKRSRSRSDSPTGDRKRLRDIRYDGKREDRRDERYDRYDRDDRHDRDNDRDNRPDRDKDDRYPDRYDRDLRHTERERYPERDGRTRENYSRGRGGRSWNDVRRVVKKEKCRYFYEKGICDKGEDCPYEHGNPITGTLDNDGLEYSASSVPTTFTKKGKFDGGKKGKKLR